VVIIRNYYEERKNGRCADRSVSNTGKTISASQRPSTRSGAISRWRTGKFPFSWWEKRFCTVDVAAPHCQRLTTYGHETQGATKKKRNSIRVMTSVPHCQDNFIFCSLSSLLSSLSYRRADRGSSLNRDYSPMREWRDYFPVRKSSVWIFTRIDDRLNYAALECTRTIPLIMI